MGHRRSQSIGITATSRGVARTGSPASVRSGDLGTGHPAQSEPAARTVSPPPRAATRRPSRRAGPELLEGSCPYQDIDWYAGAAGEHLGTSQTDGRGIATIEGGSISDIGTSITGEIGGYSAKYLGNEEFLPSEGHGRVVPVFGIS
ncbi:hypothetical protein DNK55_13610 [Streptomyces sp. AC1-42T]|nr:hypothetical protein DNK55_13610 [Streptomyces sp. AC1-42T]